MSRKEGGRVLTSIDDWVRASLRGLEDYIKIDIERFNTAASCSSGNMQIEKHQKQGIRNGTKNNPKIILSGKRVKLRARKLGHDYKREESKDKLKILK